MKKLFIGIGFGTVIFIGYWSYQMYLFGRGVQEDAKRIENLSLPDTIVTNLIPYRFIKRTSENYEFDTLDYHSINFNYTIYPSGELLKSNKNQSFKSKLSADKGITKALFLKYSDGIILFYTDSDMETSRSYVESFTDSLEDRWVAIIPGFNVGKPLVKKKYAYVSAIGFVGKLNLNSGKYEWKHENLYKSDVQSFNYFDEIVINQNKVEFISHQFRTENVSKVIVDDQSGDLLRIESP